MRYTVAVDFDGVIHSYISPWKNARTIPDPAVLGAIPWLVEISQKFSVAIFTTRNHQFLGRWAVKRWLRRQIVEHYWKHLVTKHDGWTAADVNDVAQGYARRLVASWSFPSHKPAALIYLDDRAWRFEGIFPTAEQIHRARPWNRPENRV